MDTDQMRYFIKTFEPLIQNEDRPMKYKVTTDRHPFKKGTEFEFDESIDGIEFNARCDKMPRIGNGYLNNYPNDFQPIEQIESGQYWAWTKDERIFRVGEQNEWNSENYEIKYIAEDDHGFVSAKYIEENARKLSTDEIQQALIKEAKRRGFDGSKNIKSWKANGEPTRYGLCPENTYRYDPVNDWLLVDEAIVCYEGNWAEIKDQTPDIEINGKTIEVENGEVKISCGDTIDEEMYKNFYALVNKYDLDVSRNGEQINDQLRKIWDEVANLNGKPITFSIEVDGSDILTANSGTISHE